MTSLRPNGLEHDSVAPAVAPTVAVAPVAAAAGPATWSISPARVPRDLLLWLYAVVPIGVLVPLVDAFALGSVVRRTLPAVPDQLLLWTLVFNVPHIVASHLLLLDAEYLRHYRKPLAFAFALLALWLVFTFALFDPVTMLWLNAAITMYHVIGQQVGITRLMGGGDPGRPLVLWKLGGVAIFLLALAESFRVGTGLSPAASEPGLALWLGAALCAPLMLVFAQVYRRVQSPRAKLYVLANQVMFLAFVPLAHTGYSFFLALMPRVVHDLSAFAFYICHDQNRNREAPRSLLYRALGFTGLPPWFLLPAVSIGIGYLLLRIDSAELLYPIGALSLLHYVMEGVVWKRDGLHRKQLGFA